MVVANLVLLGLAFIGVLFFTSAALVGLLLWLAYMPLPGIAKAVLFVALVLASIAITLVYAKRQRQTRRQAARCKTVVETLDFGDTMMNALELPRLSPGQRDVLRGAFDVLLENWSQETRK